MSQARRRGGFSDRNIIKPLNTKIQLTDFDKHERVELFNPIAFYFGIMYKNSKYPHQLLKRQNLCWCHAVLL